VTDPTRAETQRLRRQRRPIQNGATIVNLANDEKHEYSKVRSVAFSGEASTYIALARYGPPAPGGGGAAAAGGRGGGAPGGRRGGGAAGGPSDRPQGTDLILRELASGKELKRRHRG